MLKFKSQDILSDVDFVILSIITRNKLTRFITSNKWK